VTTPFYLQAGQEIFKYDPDCRYPEDPVLSLGLYKMIGWGKKSKNPNIQILFYNHCKKKSNWQITNIMPRTYHFHHPHVYSPCYFGELGVEGDVGCHHFPVLPH
jgi:hypothetical protein